MLAPTQRRHLSYYFSLPLVVAITLLVVAKLVALQRADIIAELADRVAHRDSPDAAAAVRQLASMPHPPVAILVSAATSADPEVAEEARLCIGRLLRHAQRRIEAEQRLGAVARQLAELAGSLAAQQSMFSTADYPWLSNTTRKVLRLANRIPPRHTPLVAVHCDAILAAIESKEHSTSAIVDHEPAIDEPFVDDAAMVEDGGQSRQARLQREVSVTARSPAAIASEHTQVSERVREDPPGEISAEELMTSPWRASWSHPIFRMVPAKPINAPPTDQRVPVHVPSSPLQDSLPADTQASDPPLAGVDARELLRRWLDADGSEIFPLEEELTRRGFGRLSERLVQQLFSSKAEDRLALVDGVLTEPGVDARPWLVLLSEDAEADVRLLAVTIMATSNDAALVEKAWQVAIRDRDPRVAGLAGRLRERRQGAERR